MCYAIPGKLIDIKNNIGIIDYFGERKKVRVDFIDVKVGDYVYAQGGILIDRISKDEAEEVLRGWKELFFELKKRDQDLSQINTKTNTKNLLEILQKINLGQVLTKEEILYLLDLKEKEEVKLLFETANNIRQKEHKNACCVHGIIEFSNICRNNCFYCGLRKNRQIPRYRMSIEEIIEVASYAVKKLGFKALVLQSGEDLWYTKERLIDIVKEIRKLGVLIFLSIGEREKEIYETLFEVGAKGVLLRFETSNYDIFSSLRPNTKLENRLNLIKFLKDKGYVLATGFLVGLPKENREDIIENILLTKKFKPDMYSFGPLVPTLETPLENYKPIDKETLLKTIAITRLLDKDANILVTTAFQTLYPELVRDALLVGANSLMINVTPIKYKRLYEIYNPRFGCEKEATEIIRETLELLYSLGRAPTDLGIKNSNLEDLELREWIDNRIKLSNIYISTEKKRDFINEEEIFSALEKNTSFSLSRVREILNKSLSIETLNLEETATLLNVKEPKIWEEIFEVALQVKRKVYDNRIVTFAPLYLSNLCVNNCLYCGFRKDNFLIKRKILTLEELKKEIEILAGKIGHKRLIVVYGEHPKTNIDYMISTIETIYNTKVKTNNGVAEIRRVNVNAPPLSIEELKKLKEVGIGTYQVFQETYHRKTYEELHPKNTIKSNYYWRLYCMHRALEAGIDDVGIGVLFGLYNWKFEVLGLVSHAIELEKEFGVGPHTISFPRLKPALNTPFVQNTCYKVNDEDFKKIIAVLRLAVPYTGMIVTARESANIRKEVLSLGCTQTDASSKIGIGSYNENKENQDEDKQQFLLGDTRSLEELVRELASLGYIVSFCTAGYRCGRTGSNIMELLKSGKEGIFCKLNAVLTFKEWLEDFANQETKRIGEKIINKEAEEIRIKFPLLYPKFISYYKRIESGERDIFF